MKIIGLTGPSGAGKGFCYSFFETHGIPCIDTDDVYHKLLISPSDCVDELVKNFGETILSDSREIDRKKLANIVFSDATHKKLDTLNSITHKYVIEKTKAFLETYQKENRIAAVIDAPLLFEARIEKLCDFTIAVISKKDLRLNRIMVRDGITEEAAKMRIDAQKSSDYYTSNATYTVTNNSDIESLNSQLKIILKKEAIIG